MNNDIVSEAQGIFVANAKNLVVIEVESTPAIGGWQPETQYEGYTGTGYYRWTSKRRITKSDADQTILRYNVSLTESGPYRLSLRALRNGVAEGRDVRSDEENDFWIRINGGDWIKMPFFVAPGEWGWANNISLKHNVQAARFDLEAGINTLEISGRSSNAMLDRIHLSKNQVNTDITKSQSDRINGAAESPIVANTIDNVQITENGVTTEIDLFSVFDDVATQDDDLVYVVSSNSNTALVSSVINPTTGKLTLSYAADAEGIANLVVKATDEDGLSTSTGFSVNIDLPEPSTPTPTPPTPTPPTTPTPTPTGPKTPTLTPTGPLTSLVVGTPQSDRPLFGTPNNDTINALGGKDKVSGLSGDDIISGGGGRDVLRGNGGNDILRGNNGNDKLLGGAGNDELDGGRGRDIYKGGAGNDIFVISTGAKFDIIRDFKEGDVIRLGNGLRFNQLDIFQDGRNTVIAKGNDTLAVLSRFTGEFGRDQIG